MASHRLLGFASLALTLSACFGNVSLGGPGDTTDEGGTSTPPTTTSMEGGTTPQQTSPHDTDGGVDAISPASQEAEGGTGPSSDSSPGTTIGGATTVFIDSTNGFNDGAVATDGTTLFWVAEASAGGAQIVSCPVSGCPAGGPSVFWATANWGDGLGELVLVNGLLYFQEIMNGPIYDCPMSGCGAGPTEYVSVSSTSEFAAALASDGANLYWTDNGSIHACALDTACSAPRVVAPLASSAYVSEIVPSGANVYWVASSALGGPAPTLQTAPVTGGAASTLCTLTENQYIDTVAVVGDYVYLTPGSGDQGNGAGIYRCPVSGGAATLYYDDSSPFDITSDGTTLYWLSEAENDEVTLKSCASGATCETPTSLFEVLYTTGFTISGNDVYSVSGKIRRTTL